MATSWCWCLDGRGLVDGGRSVGLLMESVQLDRDVVLNRMGLGRGTGPSGRLIKNPSEWSRVSVDERWIGPRVGSDRQNWLEGWRVGDRSLMGRSRFVSRFLVVPCWLPRLSMIVSSDSGSS